MLQRLLPALLLALVAAPVTAQATANQKGGYTPLPTLQKGLSVPTFQSIAKPTLPQTPSRAPGGLYAVGTLPPGGAWLDPAYVAAQRARFELAKAKGKVCPLREAHIQKRLADLEAQLAAQQKGPLKPFASTTGFHAAGTGK